MSSIKEQESKYIIGQEDEILPPPSPKKKKPPRTLMSLHDVATENFDFDQMFKDPPADEKLRTIKLDSDLYLQLDRWKAKLRLLMPGKRVTLRGMFHRAIFLLIRELEEKYGTLE